MTPAMTADNDRCPRCGALFFLTAGGPRPEFYDRNGRAYCSYNCAHPPPPVPRRPSNTLSWPLLLWLTIGIALALLALANWLMGRPIL